MGSSVYAGLKDRDEMLDRTDLAGVTVRDALDGDRLPRHRRAPAGRRLRGDPHRAGTHPRAGGHPARCRRLQLVHAEARHRGARRAVAHRRHRDGGSPRRPRTPPPYVIIAFNEITREYPPQVLVSSVGQIVVEPNSPIVVNRRVHLVGDLRANDPAIVRDARDRLVARCAEIADAHDVEIIAKDFDIRPNLYFPQEGVKLRRRWPPTWAWRSRPMQTMAGHDSVAMNTVAPTVMMFIPSVDGVSHCEREFTLDQDMLTGVDMLDRSGPGLVDGALAEASAHDRQRPRHDRAALPRRRHGAAALPHPGALAAWNSWKRWSPGPKPSTAESTP